MLKSIAPEQAAALLRQGAAVLVDVREPAEHARARIPGAHNVPLSRLDGDTVPAQKGETILFHCRSGARTQAHAGTLAAAAAGREALVMAGGIDAWRRAGLPVDGGAAPAGSARRWMVALVLAGIVLAAYLLAGARG
jgi:rhodanese-related sulfurtransferase